MSGFISEISQIILAILKKNHLEFFENLTAYSLFGVGEWTAMLVSFGDFEYKRLLQFGKHIKPMIKP